MFTHSMLARAAERAVSRSRMQPLLDEGVPVERTGLRYPIVFALGD